MIDCRVIVRLLGILAGAATIAAMPLRASQAVNKPAVTGQAAAARLLELGEHNSPAALTAVRAYHDNLRAKPGYDARIEYAFVLVLIRQHCRTEAVELLDAILKREPDGLHLWRAKIWAEMAVHKERAALADIRSVADVLARQTSKALPESEAESRRATAEFLGRVFGFLEIPRANALAADEVRGAKQYLLARLGEGRAEFDQGEEMVAEKFSKAREAFEEQRATRLAAAKTRQDQIGQKKKLIDETETSVDYDTEKVKTNTKTEVDRLDKAAEMVNKNILTCQFRLNGLRQAIQVNQAKLDIQTQNIASRGPPPSDPIIGASLVPDLVTQDQLINLLARLTAEQALLTRQVNQLTEELRTTIAQRDALLELGDRSTAVLKTQAASLKRDGKKLERAQQAEAKKIVAERYKTVLTKQTPFATFEPFPYGTEKQRVVGAVDP
ncbi:MAG TPA: hypothetical protein VHY91_07715 [Pirellulales bacterium]|nr:hypothetical protein [Pirellulales bacterium]